MHNQYTNLAIDFATEALRDALSDAKIEILQLANMTDDDEFNSMAIALVRSQFLENAMNVHKLQLADPDTPAGQAARPFLRYELVDDLKTFRDPGSGMISLQLDAALSRSARILAGAVRDIEDKIGRYQPHVKADVWEHALFNSGTFDYVRGLMKKGLIVREATRSTPA